AIIAGQNANDCNDPGDPYPCCTGPFTGPDCVNNPGLFLPQGAAIDPSGNFWVVNGATNGNAGSLLSFSVPFAGCVAGVCNIAATNTVGGSLSNFACFGAGNPSSCCTGPGTGNCPDLTQFDYPSGVTFDPFGTMYATNAGGSCSLTWYGAGATGNAPPLGVIGGQSAAQCNGPGDPYPCCTAPFTGPTCVDNTGLSFPLGAAIDLSGNLLVTNNSADNVTVYSPPLVSGDPAPVSTITNGVTSPVGIVIVNGKRFVANFNGGTGMGSVTEYDSTGNAVATLSGSNTGLSGPSGVAFGILP